MTAFEVGGTYWTRSICDYDCIYEVTVAKRTEKTITTKNGNRLGIKVWNDVEMVMPFGRYSMAPAIGADKKR